MNPFDVGSLSPEECIQPWQCLYVRPDERWAAEPCARMRILAALALESEQLERVYELSDGSADSALRRSFSMLRRVERQQQMKLACLCPAAASALEEAIACEHMAVELTAVLARRTQNAEMRRALYFTLGEDADHLYRLANVQYLEDGVPAEELIGRRLEIRPGRPTMAQHRHPYDAIGHPLGERTVLLADRLHRLLMLAVQRYEARLYASLAQRHPSELGRRLLQEIAMVEEQHATEWEGMLDPRATRLERLLVWQYLECYLYASWHEAETDSRLKGIWSQCFEQEAAHLREAARLLDENGKNTRRKIIPDGEFPPLLHFEESAGMVREALADTAGTTRVRGELLNVRLLPDDFDYFDYQRRVNAQPCGAPSRLALERLLELRRRDYRFEIAGVREETRTPERLSRI